MITLEQYCVVYFGFLPIHQRNYLKLVWDWTDDFEQVNVGCLMSYVIHCIGESIYDVNIKLNLKVQKICRDCSPDFLWNDNAPIFSLDLPEAYLPFETPNIECFAKIVSGWIQSTIFAKSFILDLLLGSEYVSDYVGGFSIIMNWGCHFECSKNLSNVMSILFKYLKQKFSP